MRPLGCEPWTGTLPHPLLCVNSEEFSVGKEYAIWNSQMKDTIEHSVKPMSSVFTIRKFSYSLPIYRHKLICLAIFCLVYNKTAGATHPSFSDIFLILPEKVNRLTGLKVDAHTVLDLCIGAVWDFVRGMSQATRMRATEYTPAPPRSSRKSSSATIASLASATGGKGKSVSSSTGGSGNGSVEGSPNLSVGGKSAKHGNGGESSKEKEKQKVKIEHEKEKEKDAQGLPRKPVGKIGQLIHHPF